MNVLLLQKLNSYQARGLESSTKSLALSIAIKILGVVVSLCSLVGFYTVALCCFILVQTTLLHQANILMFIFC